MNSILLTSFLAFVWWLVIIWFLAMVIWMFLSVFADIFRRRDLSGIAKAFWIFLVFIIPLIGILIYFIARPADATAEQDAELAAAARRATGYSASAEIEKAQQLLAAGTITQAEFDDLKAKALA